MESAKQGVSLREIARVWGVSSPYVSKFLKRAGLGPLPDGTYSLTEATALRGKYTRVGKGQRKWARGQRRRMEREIAMSPEVAVCQGCGGLYRPSDAVGNGSPHPRLYCEDACAEDVAAAKTRAQIRARIRKNSEGDGRPASYNIFNWVHPDGTPNVPEF